MENLSRESGERGARL